MRSCVGVGNAARVPLGRALRDRGVAFGLGAVSAAVMVVLGALSLSPPTARAESPSVPSPAPLRVLAAASLTEVVEALAASFPDGAVSPSFGATSDLARQIKDGAPADVFLSASPEWVDFLREAGALAGEPILIARNALVCVASQGSRLGTAAMGGPAGSARVRDPRTLLERVAAGDEIVAIADAGVPAGDYARKALAKLGLAAAFEPHFVGQKDVRAVLHAVEQGEVAAGFVYATDARIARVETLFAFDPATHPPIEYLAVVVRKADESGGAGDTDSRGKADSSRNARARGNADLAQRFVAYLRSDAARARLSAAGFVLP